LLIVYLKKHHPERNPTTVFISSPKGIAQQLGEEVSEQGRRRDYKGYRVFTSLDTDKYLREHAEKCKIIDDFYGDVLSTLEKEILSWSRIFFRSRPSNWSFNIQGRRMSRYSWLKIKDDRTIFDIFPKELYVYLEPLETEQL